VTLGVIAGERSVLATVIALACESVGHDCLLIRDCAQTTRIVHSIRVDTIVVDFEQAGLSTLDWLELVVPSWPAPRPQTLLLAESELTPRDAARLQTLGAEVVYTPSCLSDTTHLVMQRLRQARSARTGRVEGS